MFSAIDKATQRKRERNSGGEGLSDYRSHQEPESKNRKNRSDNSQTVDKDYNNWSRERVVKEIKMLKAKLERLKNDKSIISIQEQDKLKEELKSLEKIKSKFNENSSDESSNGFPTDWVIGGAFFLTVGGLVTLLIIRSKRKKRYLAK